MINWDVWKLCFLFVCMLFGMVGIVDIRCLFEIITIWFCGFDFLVCLLAEEIVEKKKNLIFMCPMC